MRDFEEAMYTALALIISAIVVYVFISNTNLPTYSISKPIEAMKTSFELIDYGIIYPNTLVIYLKPTSPVNVSDVIVYINRQKAIVKKIGNTPGDIVDPNKGDLIMVSLNNFQGNKADIFVSGYEVISKSFSINLEGVKPIALINITRYFYRIPITIHENSGNNLTNYDVRIILNTQALISAGKMNPDCSDIRFTYYNSTSNTEIEIPYWIETGCNTNATRIWVKVPYIPANSNVTIYMYYGNLNATPDNLSNNGFATFPAFDNFTTANTLAWDFSAVNYTVSNGTLIITGLEWDQFNPVVWKLQNFTNVEVRVEEYSTGNCPTTSLFLRKQTPNATDRTNAYATYFSTCGRYACAAGSNEYDVIEIFTTSPTCPKDLVSSSVGYPRTWVIDVFRAYGSNLTYESYSPDYSTRYFYLTVNDSTFSSGYVGINAWLSDKTEYIKWFFARYYVSPEPSYTLGNEEITSYYPS